MKWVFIKDSNSVKWPAFDWKVMKVFLFIRNSSTDDKYGKGGVQGKKNFAKPRVRPSKTSTEVISQHDTDPS